MAYELFNAQDDEESKRRRSEAQGPAGGAVGGTVAPAPTPQFTSQTPGSAVKGDSGSNFVNFEQYFNANGEAAGNMANNVAGQVQGGAEKAITGVGDALGQFRKDVTAGSPVFGGETRVTGEEGPSKQPGVLKQGLDGGGPQKGVDGKPVNSTTGEGSGVISHADATTRAGAGYTGPTGFDQVKNYSDLVNGITKSGSQVNALSAPGGREALAQELLGSSTQGGSSLDAALMGSAGGQRFDEIGSRFGNSMLEDYLKGAQTDAAGMVKGGEAGAKDTAKKYKGLVDKYDADEAERNKPPEDPYGPDAVITDGFTGKPITDPAKRAAAIAELKALDAMTPEERAEFLKNRVGNVLQPKADQYSLDNLHETDTWKWFGKFWGA